MFQIGKFSIITRLSIKSLRHYHELGLLKPDYIDEDSGYRYYREAAIEKARVITMLREMEFSLKEIEDILENYSDDADLISFLEKRRDEIKIRVMKYEKIETSIGSIIENIRRNNMEQKYDEKITEKRLPDISFAGYRMKGIYSKIGRAFARVGKKAGRHIAGKPIGLYYDGEYREKNADFEGGFPVKKEVKGDGIEYRKLQGGRAVCLIHPGPYSELGRSYEKIFKYIEEKKYQTKLPSREVYHKGPGNIFN